MKIFLMCLIVVGCSHSPKNISPSKDYKLESVSDLPKVAVVLGPGMVRGYAHVGVLQALDKAKIPVDFIVGVEFGAIVGAVYASTKSNFAMEWTLTKLQQKDYFSFPFLQAGIKLADSDTLKSFLNTYMSVKNIEKFKIPFSAVGTNFETGDPVILKMGEAPEVVAISNIIPGIFKTKKWDGKNIVTGQMSNPMPIDVAKAMGANFIIAVDVSGNMKYGQNDAHSDALHAFFNSANSHKSLKLEAANCVIAPHVEALAADDFTLRKRLMFEGRIAAESKIPEIKQKLIYFAKP